MAPLMKLSEKVKEIKPRQILTSRGLPTVEVEFVLENTSIISSVPAGKSTGTLEACIVVDGGDAYFGLSVNKVIEAIKKHASMLVSTDFEAPAGFDRVLLDLDGTGTKKNLGANFMLPLSLCCYKLASYVLDMPVWSYISGTTGIRPSLPVPHFNVLNGGVHSGNETSCQEIMVCFEADEFSSHMEAAVKLYYALKDVISEQYGTVFTSIADEGGFAPPIASIEEGLELLLESASNAKISSFKIALDLAANTFYDSESNSYLFDGVRMDGKTLAMHYVALAEKYPIYMFEDPFNEKDYSSWEYFYEIAPAQTLIVADDLTVSNPKLIQELGGRKMFDTVLIKPTQIGTVSETLESIQLAKSMGMKVMISHRSAETEDVFIAHLAVGAGAEFIKSGAPSRGERIAKYNELLRISECLGFPENE